MCVCVFLMKRHSFPIIYLKPTPKTKAGRLPLRRHHEAAVEGNHSLASPPAAGTPWKNPCRNPWRNPWEEPHPRLENQYRESPELWPASNCSFRQYVKYLNSAQLRRLWEKSQETLDWNHVVVPNDVKGSQSGSSWGSSGKWPFRKRPLHVWKLVPTCHVHMDLWLSTCLDAQDMMFLYNFSLCSLIMYFDFIYVYIIYIYLSCLYLSGWYMQFMRLSKYFWGVALGHSSNWCGRSLHKSWRFCSCTVHQGRSTWRIVRLN